MSKLDVIDDCLSGEMHTYGTLDNEKRSAFSLIKERFLSKPAIIAGLAALSVFNMTPAFALHHKHDFNTGVFGGQTLTSQEATEANNSVFIVNKQNDRSFSLLGTGTVIADSQNSSGHNRVLTAMHVASMESIPHFQKFGLAKAEINARNSDSHVVVYDNKGNELGNARLVTRSLPEHEVHSPDEKVSMDIAVLDIEPTSHVYDTMKGAELAQDLPSHPFSSKTNSDIGFTQGASGSGVYQDGKIVGVFNNFFQLSPEADTLYNLVMEKRKALDLQPLFYEDNGELDTQPGMLLLETVFKRNYGQFAPIVSNPEVMSALGHASDNKNAIEKLPDDSHLQMFSFPYGMGLKYDSYVDNSKDLRYKIQYEYDQLQTAIQKGEVPKM